MHLQIRVLPTAHCCVFTLKWTSSMQGLMKKVRLKYYLMYSLHPFFYTQVSVGGPPSRYFAQKKDKRQRQTAVAKGGEKRLSSLCILPSEQKADRRPQAGITEVSDHSVHCALPTCIHMLCSAYSNMTWVLLEVRVRPQ